MANTLESSDRRLVTGERARLLRALLDATWDLDDRELFQLLAYIQDFAPRKRLCPAGSPRSGRRVRAAGRSQFAEAFGLLVAGVAVGLAALVAALGQRRAGEWLRRFAVAARSVAVRDGGAAEV